ncbi:hypothetical protein F5Y17DRAFT_310971 [Xylariaceae sp. FL0594]|nr:hypothetical protein F5Y17DRAFT_310971 [Xylariaceae sp. FL0594]
MATAMMYSNQHRSHYGYPQPPPSPPMDDASKCSLPSISNLLVMADAGSPTSETSPQSQSAPSMKSDTRPNSSHYPSNGHSRNALPLTPPMSADSFEGHGSPSTKPLGQVPAMAGHNSYYYYERTPPLEEVHRQQTSPTVSRVPTRAQPYSSQAFASSYLSQSPMPAYYTPTLPSNQSQVSGLFYQRPLPQNFSSLPVAVSLAPSSGANPWQHHHYISPSSAASFPQSQDRYVCQTCSKAFSRPSSLRIHSHSHTGEKPFKCPHAGCGKAFSVRSNMKRHERGCHSYNSRNSALR